VLAAFEFCTETVSDLQLFYVLMMLQSLVVEKEILQISLDSLSMRPQHGDVFWCSGRLLITDNTCVIVNHTASHFTLVN
jgi:hypothetical protein